MILYQEPIIKKEKKYSSESSKPTRVKPEATANTNELNNSASGGKHICDSF